MDSKDFQLLAALHENARQSFRSLGRRVSLSAPAVRERLRRLQTRGVLNGYWLYPEPSIFDRDELLLIFRGDWSREDALRVLEARNVAFVALKLDGSLTVQVWPRNRGQSIGDLTGTLRTTPSEQSFTPRRSLKRLPLAAFRIVDVLVDDPRMPLNDICRSTGLTPKTVRKHLERLIQEETVYLMPRLGALVDSGDLLYYLSIRGKVGMSELSRLLGDAVLVNATHEPPIKYLLCRSNALADVTAKTRAIGKLSGVDAVEVTLNRELMVNTALVHSLIAEQIRARNE